MEGRTNLDCIVSFATIKTIALYPKNELHATLWLAPHFFITQQVQHAPIWAT